jgi:hypothetical protein
MRTEYCRVVMEFEFKGRGTLGHALWVCGWLWEAVGMRVRARVVTTDFLCTVPSEKQCFVELSGTSKANSVYSLPGYVTIHIHPCDIRKFHTA